MSLHYLTVFYLKLNLKLEIDHKTCNLYNLKNLEEILKIGQNLPKTFGSPVYRFMKDV